jgi:hypothetical protein
MATLTPEQISRAAKIAGGNYIEPSTRAGLIANGKWNVPEIKSAINASIAALRQVQAEQQKQAQVQARPSQSLESTAVNLGYSGDYTDTNAMQDFINKVQVQPQVQAATTSPSDQSVLTLNNPTGLAVTGQPTAQVQPTMTTLYKDGRTVSVNDVDLKSYLASGWSTDSSPPDKPVAAPDIPPPVATPATPNTQSLFTEGNTTLGKTLADANTTFGKTFTDADTTFGKTLADANTTFGKTFTDADTTFGKTLAEGNTTVGNTLNNWGDAYSTKMDATLQNFGTQATNGFMGAFKNFAIPTSQQNGVNLGNYNDNRNAAADQWWSSYVTGRR